MKCVWLFQAELQKQLDKHREQWESDMVRLVGCGPTFFEILTLVLPLSPKLIDSLKGFIF